MERGLQRPDDAAAVGLERECRAADLSKDQIAAAIVARRRWEVEEK
jgi:hypothetical protein